MKGKMITIVIVMLGVMFVAVGCGGNTESAENPTPTPEQTYAQPVPTEQLVQPPDYVNWLTPGKVEVTSMYIGATAEYPMRVHNGHAETTSFNISARLPDYTAFGFLPATPDALSWVTIVGGDTPLAPYETRDLTVSLTIPYGAISPAPQWEFWVCVTDASQSTSAPFVQEETCTRWLITME